MTDTAQLYDERGNLTQYPNQWQPIETAPKNGTRVLVTNGIDVQIEFKDNDDEMWSGWQTGTRLYSVVPTHWMPLPEPPKTT